MRQCVNWSSAFTGVALPQAGMQERNFVVTSLQQRAFHDNAFACQSVERHKTNLKSFPAP